MTNAVCQNLRLELFHSVETAIDPTARTMPVPVRNLQVKAFAGEGLARVVKYLEGLASKSFRRLMVVLMANDICSMRDCLSEEAWNRDKTKYFKMLKELVSQCWEVASESVVIVYGGKGSLWSKRWKRKEETIMRFDAMVREIRQELRSLVGNRAVILDGVQELEQCGQEMWEKDGWHLKHSEYSGKICRDVSGLVVHRIVR